MIPRRVWLAVLLAFTLHGIFILGARYRLSYDAYTHMLFADHYLHSWWSLWDPRWYAGFQVNSYPPLVHQLIALLGHLIGVDAGYAVISWVVLAAYPLAVYAFARLFVGQAPAEYSALGAALLPSIYLTAYTFGQLPTLTGTLLALFCAAALAEYLKTGRRLSGALAVMLAATMMSAHHATLLFLPWLVLAVGLQVLLNQQARWQTWLPRLLIFGLLAGLASLLVIWPFWQWGQHQAMQTPIDHATRHNYLTDTSAAFLFFWSIYGPMVAILPFALWKLFNRQFFPLSLTFGFLFILGLGGTTPLPRWLFGAGWAWLTYDRFAFWATLLLLPFLGLALARLGQDGPFLRILKSPWKEKLAQIYAYISCNWLLGLALVILAGFSTLVGNYPTLLPTQPKAVEMQPIVNFLAQGGRSQWRYLTFGFGDQFAYLNRLTSATTIDGSYHTARTLPELRTSGIGSIDSTFWLKGGFAALDPVLQSAGKYGVRWGFVDNRLYVPILIHNGWIERATLSDGVQVWENPKAILPAAASPPAADPLASFSWGALPLLAFAVTTALAGLRLRPALAEQILLKIHTIAVGLLPVGLVFWYFFPLTNIQYPRVYFVYDNAAFYLSDAIAVIAVIAWALARIFSPVESNNIPSGGVSPKRSLLRRWVNSAAFWLFSLCLLASLSIIWSKDWRYAAYLSLHLWLGLALFVSLKNRPEAWKAVLYGFCVALGIQVFTGFFEFFSQSTGFLSPLHMTWPGPLNPATPGASVVQLAGGVRWLRAYGTLPHPNILGTFVVVLLAGPVAFFLSRRKPAIWAILLFSAGTALLFLTFSRGAWVSLVAGGLVLVWKFWRIDIKRLLPLGIAGALGFIAAAIPLRALLFTRLGGVPGVPTEAFSIIGRTWLTGQAFTAIQNHPLLGIGVGSFVIDLAQHAGVGYIIEPVHNLFLLITSELGIFGAALLTGLGIVIAKATWQARTPKAILACAVLVGLGVTSLFDQSLWTLAPGRTILALVLGIWTGQVEHEQNERQ